MERKDNCLKAFSTSCDHAKGNHHRCETLEQLLVPVHMLKRPVSACEEHEQEQSGSMVRLIEQALLMCSF